jgi:hypothetical protein
VRSRTTRIVIKAGLLGVSGAGVAMMPQVYPQARTFRPQPGTDLPVSVRAALAVGGTAVAVAGTIWGEKAIYARGERRRARGVRCAHTPAALAMALATGVVAVVDWPKLVGQLTES